MCAEVCSDDYRKKYSHDLVPILPSTHLSKLLILGPAFYGGVSHALVGLRPRRSACERAAPDHKHQHEHGHDKSTYLDRAEHG